MMVFRKYVENTGGGRVTAARRGYSPTRIKVEPVENMSVYAARELVAAIERAMKALAE